MNPVDIIIGLIVAGIFFLALRKVVKDKKSGKTCSCGCSGSGCSSCDGKKS